MEENSHAICDRMQSERDTLKCKLEEERKVILERAKLKEMPDQLQFRTAQLLWYETELKSTEEVKLQLQRDLQVAKRSKNISTDTDEYQKLQKENMLLKVRITNLTAKLENENRSLKVKLKDLTKELETATSKAEELVKRNKILNDIFRISSSLRAEATDTFADSGTRPKA